MMRGLLTFITFLSAIYTPWVFAATLTIFASILEPLLPLAVGIFADTLYYSPNSSSMPLFTINGLFITIFAYFVRSRLKPSIIGR